MKSAVICTEHRDLAQCFLSGLQDAYPVVDLFWEECIRTTLPLGDAGRSVPTTEVQRGFQLRFVGRRRAGSAWTTDLTPRGLRRAFEDLHSGVRPPRAVPRGVPSRLAPAASDGGGRWRDRAERLLAGALRRGAARRVTAATLSIERFCRGAASSPDRIRAWEGDRAMVTVEFRSDDARRSTLSLVLARGPETTGHERDVRAILEAAKQGSARAGGIGGLLPVVLGPGSGMVLMHEIVGHALEADRVLAGASPFSGMPRKTLVSNESLTVRDRAAECWGPGCVALDDEGEDPRDVTLIDRGRLGGVLHDRSTAFVSKAVPTGNGRRASFRDEPSPRIRNIVVERGGVEPDALLQGIRLGLLVERVSGSVDPSTRSFELVVESGRVIRRGACRERVTGVRVRGDTLRALRDVRGVGNDFEVSWEPVACEKRGLVMTGAAGPSVLMGPLEVTS